MKDNCFHPLSALYRQSLSLLTDFYQLTMAYGYWRSGCAEKEASFYMSFRNNPFHGGFAIACGLSHLIDYVQHSEFTDDDIAYLRSLTGDDGAALFDDKFLQYLRAMRFSCDIESVPEGSVVFAHEPLIRVTGPIIQAQLLETLLLNIINFQTLIATKAARMSISAGNQPVMEFGMRRAQGTDGALAASWAAYIGGCSATSNLLAAKIYGIPVKGTHAHSWVMAFDNELESFDKYAQALPNNCVFLVDTYDTIGGVKHAIAIGGKLREAGYELAGIRLDSGDLAYLSIEARRLLDQAGFQNTHILATNELDEHVIRSLRDQSAAIDVWGVGTKLATAYDQPALGGVYKLSAIRDRGCAWQYKLKLSEQTAKISDPGILQVRRFASKETGTFLGDMVFDENSPAYGDAVIIDPLDFTRRKRFPTDAVFEDLLVPIFKQGDLVYESPPPIAIKERVKNQLSKLHPTIKRLLNPHQYPVGLEHGLHKLKTELILRTRALEHEGEQPASKW